MTVAPYPWHQLRRLTGAQARLECIVAAWLAARSRGERLAALVGGPARASIGRGLEAGVDRLRDPGVGAAVDPAHGRALDPARDAAFDRHAARCQVRVGGAALEVRGSSLGVRRIAQRLLGGPPELAAARPLGVVERALFSLVVATALEDLGIAGDVWPELDDVIEAVSSTAGTGVLDRESSTAVELAVMLGNIPLSVQIRVPLSLVLCVPPSHGPAWPAWFGATIVDLPVVLGRCALARADVDRLAVRSLVTLDRAGAASDERRGATLAPHAGTSYPSTQLDGELVGFGGAVGLRGTIGTLEAEVTTGYVPRDMSLPDDAHVELTVGLGTARLSLRQVADLAIGQIVQLGRPLAGPFELRAAGRVVGRGELVDVDGELAVRIVSLGD